MPTRSPRSFSPQSGRRDKFRDAPDDGVARDYCHDITDVPLIPMQSTAFRPILRRYIFICTTRGSHVFLRVIFMDFSPCLSRRGARLCRGYFIMELSAYHATPTRAFEMMPPSLATSVAANTVRRRLSRTYYRIGTASAR